MAIVAAVLVVATLVAMTSGRMPAVLALMVALLAAGVLGIATPAELFSGLSNGGVITIAAMLVIAKGVLSTGVVSRVMFKLLSQVDTPTRMLVRLIPPVGAISSLINTTPIVAMLIPATKEVQQRAGIPARSVLLPVAHATTLAGSTTLVGTSSNLIIAGFATSAGVHLSMFSFVPIALPVALVGWVALVLLSRHLLRGRSRHKDRALDWRAEIPVSGKAVGIGRTATSMGMHKTAEFELVEIRRWGQPVDIDSPIEGGDLLVYRTTELGVQMLWESPRFGLAPLHLFAVTIGTENPGTVRDLQDEEDLLVVAAQTHHRFRDTPAEPGSVCYVFVASSQVLEKHEFVSLWQNVAGKAPQPGKTWVAISILVGVILAASFSLMDVSLAAGCGATLMVVSGVLSPRSAVRALDWNILAIIAGSIGLGQIVVKSGLAGYISDGILELGSGNIPLMVAVLAIGTTLLTNFVTNAAAAAILTPVALTIASSADLSPVLLLTLIGTCISFTFINPYSHQSNLMVMEPGNYTTRTFVRFGIPITLISLVTVFLVAWPLLEYTR
ncbi:SLC13 family permease [Gordonia sp. (in: high G+C Gram-positive bacteria)]|uniref:SLC13 family permease n=1 Tax=Gordonia sp. (in: high G+C Gram-positive bacteria) TaxID=84139 RepID=UPI002FD99488